MSTPSHNLFSYFPKESGQDGFLCWLLSFAAQDNETTSELNACAKSMLQAFVPELAGKEFYVMDIQRQWRNVDILVTVHADDVYRIVVENKRGTQEHSGQLTRYMEAVRTVYPDSKHVGVYCQTGFQADFQTIREAGYNVLLLPDIVGVLKPFAAETSNSILKDYYDYLNEDLLNRLEYAACPPAKWDAAQIQEFNAHLADCCFRSREDTGARYKHVSNPSGGFHGVWAWKKDCVLQIDGMPMELYLQIEPRTDNNTGQMVYPICLKIKLLAEHLDSTAKRAARNSVTKDRNGHYQLDDFGFQRPARFGSGRTMTVGSVLPNAQTAGALEKAFCDAFEAYERVLLELRQEHPQPVSV